VTTDGPRLFEANARFGSGVVLSIAAGADQAAMLADALCRREVAPAVGAFRSGTVMLRYDEAFFLGPES
jgi:carbamoyl-phosphate synthase large subunit